MRPLPTSSARTFTDFLTTGHCNPSGFGGFQAEASDKVEIEPITGEEREATGSQDLSQGVDHPMSHVLGAGTELKHRQNLGARVDRHPQPEHVLRAAQPGSQFIQLEVREPEMGEEAHVQGVCVHGLPVTAKW